MTLNKSDVFYLGGEVWWDYVNIADGATPDVVGVAASEILQCGNAQVVLLEGGFAGPGALVSNSSGNHHVWLSGDIWAPYKAAGGPTGLLGRPLGDSIQQSEILVRADFEGGSITRAYGDEATVDPSIAGSEPFDAAECTTDNPPNVS
jgi:hypothetical protein